MHQCTKFRNRVVGLSLFIFISCYQLSAQSSKHSFEFAFSPSVGYRALSANVPSYFTSLYGQTPSFSYGFSLEYKRNFGQRISFGVGIEYQNLRYSYNDHYLDVDSLGNAIDLGNISMTYNHHYIGMPLRLYVNMVSNDKFKFYGFVGINPRITIDLVNSLEWTATDGSLVLRQSNSYFNYSNYGVSPFRFSLEAQAGVGINYHFTPKIYLLANAMFGINCLPTFINASYNEFNYRAGGSIGLGYVF